jgi:hypothetical protein
MRTSFGKRRSVEEPYAVFIDDREDFEYRVLKTYQHATKEAGNAYARWLVAVRSPFTRGSWEEGDMYIGDVGKTAKLTAATDEWKVAYNTAIGSEHHSWAPGSKDSAQKEGKLRAAFAAYGLVYDDQMDGDF